MTSEGRGAQVLTKSATDQYRGGAAPSAGTGATTASGDASEQLEKCSQNARRDKRTARFDRNCRYVDAADDAVMGPPVVGAESDNLDVERKDRPSFGLRFPVFDRDRNAQDFWARHYDHALRCPRPRDPLGVVGSGRLNPGASKVDVRQTHAVLVTTGASEMAGSLVPKYV